MLHAQIVSILQRGEASRTELAAEVQTTAESIKLFLNELRDLGVVYVKSRPKLGPTSRTEMFALNARPFENTDAPRVTTSRRKETQCTG